VAVEADLYSLLSGNAGVAALTSTRIYPDVLPEDCSYPAIVFSRTGTEPIVGVSGNIFGADVTLVISCWSRTRTAADAVAVAVEAALAGSAFTRGDRAASYDPDAGLFAATVAATTLEI
jgi:hypothetical protein